LRVRVNFTQATLILLGQADQMRFALFLPEPQEVFGDKRPMAFKFGMDSNETDHNYFLVTEKDPE
jgi:hypothetical protein